MLVDADLSSLEYKVAAELCKDPLMISEIVEGLDIHSANAINLFGDVKYRQAAKVLTFRLLYGGSAYAFHKDTNMPPLGLAKWEEIVENFYSKYAYLRKWQQDNYQFVTKHGWYASPTGRRFIFHKVRKFDGTQEYSWPSVCNYMVQSVATADVMPLVLVKLLSKFRRLSSDIKLINQVHDSVIIDCPDKYLSVVAETCLQEFENIPKLMQEHYSWDWKTPMSGEVKYGTNWSAMSTYEREPF